MKLYIQGYGIYKKVKEMSVILAIKLVTPEEEIVVDDHYEYQELHEIITRLIMLDLMCPNMINELSFVNINIQKN
jgi:phage pi2 protein 07